MSLDALNADDGTLLRSACGSSRWVRLMLDARPFGSREALLGASQRAFAALGDEDIHEAMSHHPRIGETRNVAAREATEQAGAMSADDRIKAALLDGNRKYEARFGHIYLVCASGKSGEQLLNILRARLANGPAAELRVAAAEQEKITHLRLEKLLA